MPQGERSCARHLSFEHNHPAHTIALLGMPARMVVREDVPGGAAGAVVFPHRALGALGKVWSPQLPVLTDQPLLRGR